MSSRHRSFSREQGGERRGKRFHQVCRRENMKRRACVIGLGSMGYGAAASLLRAGFEVSGVDVRADVLERFAKEGGRAEHSAAAGARDAEAVLTFVVNAAQTEAVLFGDESAAA